MIKPDLLLRRADVERRTGLSCTTIYRLMRAGAFPEPVRVGPRAVRWPASEIEAWREGKTYTVPVNGFRRSALFTCATRPSC